MTSVYVLAAVRVRAGNAARLTVRIVRLPVRAVARRLPAPVGHATQRTAPSGIQRTAFVGAQRHAVAVHATPLRIVRLPVRAAVRGLPVPVGHANRSHTAPQAPAFAGAQRHAVAAHAIHVAWQANVHADARQIAQAAEIVWFVVLLPPMTTMKFPVH